MTKKAAIYVRVSTKEQTENYSIEFQKESLEAYCKAKGWTVYDIYTDGGYTGSNMDRPGLQGVLRDLPHLDCVVVYKLDRLSRSQRDTLELIEQHFLKNEVDFVSMTETLDTSTPFGKAMLGILSVFAQLERETITERMRNGRIKKIKDGYRPNGGDYDPSGYERVAGGELKIKPDEAKHIQRLFDLYEQTHSITKASNQLNREGYKVWRFNTYRNILSNKLYIGKVKAIDEYYDGRHDAIISENQFNRVQALLSRHKGQNAGKAKQSLLSGLMKCKRCGEPYLTYMSRDKRNGKVYRYRYYICRSRRFPAKYGPCKNDNWKDEKLEGFIIQELKRNFSITSTNQERVTRTDYDAQIERTEKKISRLLDLYTEGDIDKDMLNEKIESLNAEKEYLATQKLADESKAQNIFTDQELKERISHLESFDFDIKRATIQTMVSSIIIDGQAIEIEWNF